MNCISVCKTENFLVFHPWRQRHFGDVKMKRGKRAHYVVMNLWNSDDVNSNNKTL